MTHQQQRSAWSELQQRRGLEEARMTVQHLEQQLADIEGQLGPARQEEQRRRVIWEATGAQMVAALARRGPGESLLVRFDDPERAAFDVAERDLRELTTLVSTLDARRASAQQARAHWRRELAARIGQPAGAA